MNCHAQIWTNAALLEPVRNSWYTGQSIPWIRIHDLPDYVFFNHEIHVNKGIGCETCHGRVDEMPLMYEQNTLQMEWCLDCHRNPAKNLRPTSQIYNMAWEKPADDQSGVVRGGRSQEGRADGAERDCTTTDPSGSSGSAEMALLQLRPVRAIRLRNAPSGNAPAAMWLRLLCRWRSTIRSSPARMDLGHFLLDHYKIRNSRDLMSCEVCHR